MTDRPTPTPERDEEEIQITDKMLDAGEAAILGEVGGADLGGSFSARDLASAVWKAMSRHLP